MLPTCDQVQRTAYERWLRRGWVHGHDREDWYAAEKELLFRINYQTIVEFSLDSDQRLVLGDGAAWGVSLTYAAQTEPRGLADAFIVGREFVGRDRVALVLGDNMVYGAGLSEVL